jgi:hypothetical protein
VPVEIGNKQMAGAGVVDGSTDLLIEQEDKMEKIRYGIIAMVMLICSVSSAEAQVSIGIGLPHVNIGINLPLYPALVPVPGYPVYYAPQVNSNYFFYDGMYWVFTGDYWYASSWYNGPWWIVDPYAVPLYILRIPVRYYRQPPVYFHGWRHDAPPRWGKHWGHGWEQHRRGWNRWDRSSVPHRAPLPVYQRHYSGDRYPRVEQQEPLRSQHYRYQPRETVVRRHYEQQGEHRAPPPSHMERREGPPVRGPGQQDTQRPAPQYRGDENIHRAAPPQPPPQQRAPSGKDQRQPPGAAQHQQKEPGPQRAPDKGVSQEPSKGHGQGEKKGDERGREHDK